MTLESEQDYDGCGVLAVGEPVFQRTCQLHEPQCQVPAHREADGGSVRVCVCRGLLHRHGTQGLPGQAGRTHDAGTLAAGSVWFCNISRI